MVHQLHNGMMARSTDNAAVSKAFAVTNIVKQGCVLAPTLFSLTSSAMLMDAFCEELPAILATYRTDGKFLHHRQMHFQSRVSTTTFHKLLFVDDCALNATTERDMQRGMYLFHNACENFGLVINTEKMVIMHQPATRCRLLHTPNPRERRQTASGGQLRLPGQHLLPKHQNRR
nr:unnamed protein product [Spirometra erinaceieuropaei]